ncbi:hypothetical protein [Legionella massiliensis]|nr:hypothetical protein [Legionella massiliensis]
MSAENLVKQWPIKLYFARLRFFLSKFMVGAGTARTGLGMAFGQLL